MNASEVRPSIEADDTTLRIVEKLGEGSNDALYVLTRIMQRGGEIDPASEIGGREHLLILDELEIHGPRVHQLYEDACDNCITATIAVLRAWKLGTISREQIDKAIDQRAANFGEAIHLYLRRHIPDFGKTREAV